MREVRSSILRLALFVRPNGLVVLCFFFVFFTLYQYNCHSGGFQIFKCTHPAVADNVRRKNERDIPELDAPGCISKRTNPGVASTNHLP